MLSYQHSYHAGNCADVHKHLALVCLLQQLQLKETHFCYVDAHAASGVYDLLSEAALKTGEAKQGISQFEGRHVKDVQLRAYMEAIAYFNGNGAGIRSYPGSAALAQVFLRQQDRAILLEQHPQEVADLKRNLGKDSRLAIHHRDSYEGLPALLPPAIRRGMVLLDPSYEVKQEYEQIFVLLQKAWKRWGNAIFVLWFPLLGEGRHIRLLQKIKAAAFAKTVYSEFVWDTQADGMGGSGLVIINSPWHFAEQFVLAMQEVLEVLGKKPRATHRLQEVQDR
jgi:23S rRNA (adenine2030-N6)-methyltransferase